MEFPIRDLDLTNYMPPPLPDPNVSYKEMVGKLKDDPSTQVPPYKYDLFAVTNHYGSLSSGHCKYFSVSGRGFLLIDE